MLEDQKFEHAKKQEQKTQLLQEQEQQQHADELQQRANECHQAARSKIVDKCMDKEWSAAKTKEYLAEKGFDQKVLIRWYIYNC